MRFLVTLHPLKEIYKYKTFKDVRPVQLILFTISVRVIMLLLQKSSSSTVELCIYIYSYVRANNFI